jgi:hypothetical protein
MGDEPACGDCGTNSGADAFNKIYCCVTKSASPKMGDEQAEVVVSIFF